MTRDLLTDYEPSAPSSEVCCATTSRTSRSGSRSANLPIRHTEGQRHTIRSPAGHPGEGRRADGEHDDLEVAATDYPRLLQSRILRAGPQQRAAASWGRPLMRGPRLVTCQAAACGRRGTEGAVRRGARHVAALVVAGRGPCHHGAAAAASNGWRVEPESERGDRAAGQSVRLPACGAVCAPIDTAYLTDLGFDNTSLWIQPWRAYFDTWPARRLTTRWASISTRSPPKRRPSPACSTKRGSSWRGSA